MAPTTPSAQLEYILESLATTVLTPLPSSSHTAVQPLAEITAIMNQEASLTAYDTPVTNQASFTSVGTLDTPPAPDKKTSEFFDLPRELRDEIYDQLAVRKTVIGKEPGTNCPTRCTVNSSIGKLLLVSSQFNTEYQSRIKHQALLTIAGSNLFSISHILDTIPKKTKKKTTHLEVDFGVTQFSYQGPTHDSKRFLYNLVDNIRAIGNWTANTIYCIRFQRCRSWEIRAKVSKSPFERYMADNKATAIELFADAAKSFEGFEKLTRVEVLAGVEEDAVEAPAVNEVAEDKVSAVILWVTLSSVNKRRFGDHFGGQRAVFVV